MFTGNEPQQVSLSDASEMTANYRNDNPGEILGHYFGRRIIEDILAQEHCVGIRVYYAIGQDGLKELVISGVTANGDDICNGVLGDRSLRCPPYSGIVNPLNS